MGVDVLRHVTASVLQALSVLHRANVVHKNLRHSCILLDNNGEIRVGGYSLESRITEVFSLQGKMWTQISILRFPASRVISVQH